MPRAIATDLGKFDNYTTKETWKVSSKDTIIGYFQRGLKAEAASAACRRPSPPERRSRRTAGRGCTRASGSACASNRLFIDVKGQPVRLRLPARDVVDRISKPPRTQHQHEFVSGAAWDAFDLARQKPQVIAQATYYVPLTKPAATT